MAVLGLRCRAGFSLVSASGSYFLTPDPLVLPQYKSVFLRDLKAIHLKCNHQENKPLLPSLCRKRGLTSIMANKQIQLDYKN